MAAPPRRILITGAAGFVGRHLKARLAAVYPDATLFTPTVDVRDAEAVADAVRQAAPEACIHLAAVSSIRAAQEDEDQAWEVNLNGTLRVARAILRHAPDCQMLFTSTADAYGSSFRGGAPVDEATPLAPMKCVQRDEGRRRSSDREHGRSGIALCTGSGRSITRDQGKPLSSWSPRSRGRSRG